MRLLLLAGAPEAVQIGRALSRVDRAGAIASIARASRNPLPLGLPTRIGGWGGEQAFADWLTGEGIGAILDATHPFAARISARAARIAPPLGIDYVQFLRPAWTPGPLDRWTFLNSEAEAQDHIPQNATILLTTGFRNLDAFGPLPSRTVWVRVRKSNGAKFQFEEGGFLHRPVSLPAEAEQAAMRALGIDWVIARNTGGGTSTALVEAARRLQIPVGMIRRPPQPEAPRINTVAEALAWVRRRM